MPTGDVEGFLVSIPQIIFLSIFPPLTKNYVPGYITNFEERYSCVLFALTSEVAESVLDIISKLSNTLYDVLKLATLECIEKPEPQLNKLTTITLEKEFNTKQFQSDRQELSKELPFIAGNPKSEGGEKRLPLTKDELGKRRKHGDLRKLIIKTASYKVIQATPKPRYYASLDRSNDSGSLKFQTVSP
ncbi:hypothetical protein ACTXT7_010141 [Hymenolepis weldensis]